MILAHPTIAVRTMLTGAAKQPGNNKADGPEAIRFGSTEKLVDGVVGVARPTGLRLVAGGLLMTREAGEPLGALGVRGVPEQVAHGLGWRRRGLIEPVVGDSGWLRCGGGRFGLA